VELHPAFFGIAGATGAFIAAELKIAAATTPPAPSAKQMCRLTVMKLMKNNVSAVDKTNK